MSRDTETPLINLPLIFVTVILLLQSREVLSAQKRALGPIARPGCPETCGNVSIPFPFGIGPNCFLDHWFEINCTIISDPKGSSKPFLSEFGIEVMEITIGGYSHYQYTIANLKAPSSLIVGIPSFNMCTSLHTSIDLRGSPYNFSTENNIFMMEGCPGSAALIDKNNTIMAGCGTVCGNQNKIVVSANKCHGVECCQMPMPSEFNNGYGDAEKYSPLQFYQVGFYGHSSDEHWNCLTASMVKTEFVERYADKRSTTLSSNVPVELYWSWLSSEWPDHNPKADCWRNKNVTYCFCGYNSFGDNPYVLNGCQVPKVCKHCDADCFWEETDSSYHCKSPRILISGFFTHFAILCYSVVGAATGSLIIVFGCRWLYQFFQRRRKTYQRVKKFLLKLQEHQSSSEGVVERTKLYTYKHMVKATDNFNENRVLGKGGQGIVYKGMLTDGRIVAIKKSNLVDEGQMEQFINEVVILSQINHRHVVKLLGCCLETEVPLLIYEFISNGTLAQHIHDPAKDFTLTWPMRLKIAADSAGAVAYLHSASSTPIYHRDIKPSNILLDEKYRAKVSDFGSSKGITLDQTHLTTLVQGTMGYLDPEYFESNVFTEKSDVYSFGVVLVELLTSKKPIFRTETMEQKSLVVEFFLRIQQSRLSDILDPEVVEEAKEEELSGVIDLAKRCLNPSGRLRPTMKEVAATLEVIIKNPNEMYVHHQQTFMDREFGDIAMPEMSDDEFMSSPAPVSAASPMYIDAHPLLHDTI